MSAPRLSLSSVQKSFSRCRIIKAIQPGGFKKVYLVSYKGSNYILKLINVTNIERIKREIRAFRLAQSPYVAKLLDCGTRTISSVRFIFFIEEYVEGEELASLLNKKRNFNNIEILHFLECCVLGIESLWNPHKIVHRDIKPRNIIIRPSGDPVILDLGVARHIGLTSMTPSGVVGPGTPGYRSPEQLKGVKRTLNLRSDFFSLGICAYMMATLQHPFKENDIYIQDDTFCPPSPEAINSTIDRTISNLIMKFVDKKDYKRPRDAQNALGLIRDVRKGLVGK